MIRAALLLFLAAAAAVAIVAITGEPGRATFVWLGWRADMTAAAAVLMILLAALAAMAAWRLVLWAAEAPRRSARARAEIRRRQAMEVLTRGYLAVAAGDGSEARRLAQKAAELAEDAPGLVRILAAQAAEAAGDQTAAGAAYTAMLSIPDMKIAGHRGLMQLAAAEGRREAVVEHAQAAYDLGRPARWAFRALIQDRLDVGDWDGGLALVAGALERKTLIPLVAERARAALLAASAAQLETSTEPKVRAQALERANQAAKLQPGFAPGVAVAARLLADDGKPARAASVIEQAWKAAPHPALWLAYRDLRTSETPGQRSQRLGALVALQPEARESRILAVEAALIGGDVVRAREAARALEAEPPTQRLGALLARVAHAAGQGDEARMWIAQAAGAPQEPDWSDLDPEGRAFAYQPSDWARLVTAFAERGELAHPRHERREPTLGGLPALPTAYADTPAFRSGLAVEPVLYPQADDAFADEEPTPPPAAGSRRTPARRRLASAPRAAK